MPWRGSNFGGLDVGGGKFMRRASAELPLANAGGLDELQSIRQHMREMERHRLELERHHWEMEHRINQLAEHVGVGAKIEAPERAAAGYLYASLGWNCEAAYQFRRTVGEDRSSFFNWTYCAHSSVVDVISNDFQGLLTWENLSPAGIMIYDRRYDMSFHGSVFKATQNGQYVELAKLHLASLQSKVSHLIDKWHNVTRSNAFVTYFLKLPKIDDPRGVARAMCDLFRKKYPLHRFELIVLQSLEHTKAMPDWDEPGIHNRYLDRFATDHEPEAGDIHSWDRLFAEFPLRT